MSSPTVRDASLKPMQPDFKEVERIIEAALAEDIGTGDVTSELLVPQGATASLAFVAREPLTVCGLAVAARVFAHLDKAIRTHAEAKDGQRVTKSAVLMRVEGNARAILSAERTALNLLQRASAVATLTSRYVEAVKGTKAVILDTRKTMPGLRALDKYAARTGGGRNHRMRLDDAILIKDNHIALAGGIGEALKRAIQGNARRLPLEIECDTLPQVKEALSAGATSLLLDNMPPDQLREAVTMAGGKATLEASGNVTLETVRAIAETGVDFISVGRLTHSAPSVDIGLDIAISN
jgi:nicotinate-nucleotide pyrophosphorylase (carboxylating)